MPSGGARPGAGRPRGSLDKRPRRKRWCRPKPDPGSKQEFTEFCLEVVASGRAKRLLEEALDCEDWSVRRWALQMSLDYSPSVGPLEHKFRLTREQTSMEQALQLIHERRRAAVAVQEMKPQLLPAPPDGDDHD